MSGFVLSLYDKTGNMVKPWIDAGYHAVIVDIEHPRGLTEKTARLTTVGADLRNGWLPPSEIIKKTVFVSAFPPCDHLAISGSRWFEGKGLRSLSLSIDLFATAAELCEWIGAPYLIENPVSMISTYWRKPDHTFHPHDYTLFETADNYTKRTCLWTGGGFKMPPPNRNTALGKPDDRIHKCPPGPDRKHIRSATPMGFAKAVFEYNKP